MNQLSLTRSDQLTAIISSTANLADSTKDQYVKAVDNYLSTGNTLDDTQALITYANTQPKSTQAFLKAGIRIICQSYERTLKSVVTPESLAQVQASLMRLESIQDTIHVEQSKGSKSHEWLSPAQVRELISKCDDSLTGKRDYVLLGLLLGAGLRRSELVNLKFEHVKTTHTKDGHERTVLNVSGKGSKDRVIPISDKLAKALQEWQEICKDGYIARGIKDRSGNELTDSISPIGAFKLVRKYGKMIGKPELAPHDLRRTYAQLGYNAGVPLTQISTLLGHATLATTQKYLNLETDFETTVSDFIPL